MGGVSGHGPDRVVLGTRPTGGGHKTFPVRGLTHFQATATDHEQERWDEGCMEILTGKNDDSGAGPGSFDYLIILTHIAFLIFFVKSQTEPFHLTLPLFHDHYMMKNIEINAIYLSTWDF